MTVTPELLQSTDSFPLRTMEVLLIFERKEGQGLEEQDAKKSMFGKQPHKTCILFTPGNVIISIVSYIMKTERSSLEKMKNDMRFSKQRALHSLLMGNRVARQFGQIYNS